MMMVSCRAETPFLQRLAVILALSLAGVAAPRAMTASCQQDLDAHAAKREAAIQTINAFNKKRPSASAACAAFRTLTAAETDMLTWMTDNQGWCQLPDPFIDQFKQASAQTTKMQGQICTAAKKEADMRANGGPPRGGPPAGGGVRLPQGAL